MLGWGRAVSFCIPIESEHLSGVSALVLLLQEEKGLTLKPSSLLSPSRHFHAYSSALYRFK